METQDEKHRSFREWVVTVRDPAEANAEPKRVIRADKRTWAMIQYATLPDGRTAVHSSWGYATGGGGSPWKAFATREEAEQATINMLIKTFSYPAEYGKPAEQTQSIKTIDLLEQATHPTLF